MSNKTKAVLASWGRAFAAACLAQYLAIGVAAFDVNGEIFKSILNAGVAAVLPVVLRWLNKDDEAFGRGA